MVDCYIGEIRQIGFTFAPPGWLQCDGSLQNITNYPALYQLIGTTYGGDGQTTFGLPDLRGRVPVGAGTGGGQTVALGQMLGSESVTLNAQQVASHSHNLSTGSTGTASVPAGNLVLADVGGSQGANEPPAYGAANDLVAMGGTSIGVAGGGQPHENRQPFMCIMHIIAVDDGIYPSQT